ncbi:MAG: hypothetical protein Q4Q07_09625 [Tissierellia bacterium]|nr:hypothetical protein [Tissierellia bacterium]
MGFLYLKAKLTVGTNDYYDQYMYIEKVGPNKYHLTQRSIKSDGSELVTLCYGRYNAKRQVFEKEKSYKTPYASGQFNYTWFTYNGNFKIKGFDYMYITDDPKLYLQKY